MMSIPCVGFFYDRMKAEKAVPGVFLVHKQTPIGEVIDELELIILATAEAEWLGQLEYIPLR